VKVAVIAGSGLSAVAERIEGERRPWTHPGLDRPPAPGHKMEIVEGTLGGVPALGFAGRLHFYQGYSMAEVTEPVAQAHDWGAEVLFVTNATGSLRAELAAGEIALIRDHINLMGDNPLRGTSEFVDLSQAYDPELRRAARAAAERMGLRLPEVVYVGMSTRYLVHLDHGEQLVAVRQNMDAADDAASFQGRRVRLAWTPDHTYVLGTKER